MQVLSKFCCYDQLEGSNTRTTYRIVRDFAQLDSGDEYVYWIEQKSTAQERVWYKTYPDFVHWNDINNLWNSREFRCLFGPVSKHF